MKILPHLLHLKVPEEIIGVTYHQEKPIEKIVLAVRNDKFPFIDTKPLHETQKNCNEPQYQMEGYKTISIECRCNHELISTLYSFGDEIIVLSPETIRNEIINTIEKQRSLYRLKW